MNRREVVSTLNSSSPVNSARYDRGPFAGTPHPAARPSLQQLFVDVTDKTTRDEQIYQAVRAHRYTLKEVDGFVGLCYSTISVTANFKSAVRDSQSAIASAPFFSPCLCFPLRSLR